LLHSYIFYKDIKTIKTRYKVAVNIIIKKISFYLTLFTIIESNNFLTLTVYLKRFLFIKFASQNNPHKMKRVLNKSIPLPYFIGTLLILGSLTIIATSSYNKKINDKKMEDLVSNSSSCNYTVKRLNGYKFINPLLFVDNSCESEVLNPIKQSLNSYIEINKKSGDLMAASLYLKEFNTNDWTCINENEKYKPGSLLKVPELITFLKMNEVTPGLLNKEILFDRYLISDKKPVFISKSIQIGQKYSIRELLDYMITYSDNNATMLLNNIIDVKIFQSVFTDLGLQAPDWKAGHYPISVKEYSLFMRALYNGAYLDIKDSEFATKLLSKCDFKDGIMKGLPANTRIAHKFGESGDAIEKQLHETAIIYLDGKSYLLTVMTKGKDNKKLAEIISHISTLVFQDMINRS
jgi:beta-lactamase class A